MAIDAQQILAVLDSCCDNFTFPMLDNGYVYLAATRLSLYRATEEWAMVIEVFGYNPRAWLPDTAIYAFASTIHNRDIPKSYGLREISNLLTHNPNNDFHPVYPIEQGDWQDDHDYLVAPGATEILIRGQKQSIPAPEEYSKLGIMLEDPPRVQSFELCRFLAHVHRDLVLATDEERRFSILPTMPQILQLDEWHHPNVGDDTERPSRSQTFQQLAQVLATATGGFTSLRNSLILIGETGLRAEHCSPVLVLEAGGPVMNSGLCPVHRVFCDERAGLALAWADAERHHMKLLPPSPLLEAPDACETAEVSPTILGIVAGSTQTTESCSFLGPAEWFPRYFRIGGYSTRTPELSCILGYSEHPDNQNRRTKNNRNQTIEAQGRSPMCCLSILNEDQKQEEI